VVEAKFRLWGQAPKALVMAKVKTTAAKMARDDWLDHRCELWVGLNFKSMTLLRRKERGNG